MKKLSAVLVLSVLLVVVGREARAALPRNYQEFKVRYQQKGLRLHYNQDDVLGKSFSAKCSDVNYYYKFKLYIILKNIKDFFI